MKRRQEAIRYDGERRQSRTLTPQVKEALRATALAAESGMAMVANCQAPSGVCGG
jgi:hypothetical protein